MGNTDTLNPAMSADFMMELLGPYTLDFGKHNGRTLDFIHRNDPKYLKWLNRMYWVTERYPEIAAYLQITIETPPVVRIGKRQLSPCPSCKETTMDVVKTSDGKTHAYCTHGCTV